MLVTIEGAEACGKTTQAKLLAQRLEKEGYKVLLTKEPGSPHDEICKSIRALLLNPNNKIASNAALFLFLADRAQHIELIKKALADNFIVISDRSSLSSFVYRTAEKRGTVVEQEDMKLCSVLDMAQQISPDLCFVCSADLSWSLNQLEDRHGLDRIEQSPISFHENTHRLFSPIECTRICKMLDCAPKTIMHVPDASSHPIDFIADGIYQRVSEFQKTFWRNK